MMVVLFVIYLISSEEVHWHIYTCIYFFFVTKFTKENNSNDLLIASLDNTAVSNRGLLLKVRICS